ncbi:MAG: 3,4-dihydroxy-2-butanone-4-phosphate synthase [Halothiobacillus sp.]|nr:3,4-dihydroxy-2-butanone-4-phosphate synthase [Halothiobacillus sp.]
MKEDVDIRAGSGNRYLLTDVCACPETFYRHFIFSEERFMFTQTQVHSEHTTHSHSLLDTRIGEAFAAMRQGRPVILIDDEDRENEADLIVAAEKLTVSTMALLIRECSGIVCLCLTTDMVERLELPPMVSLNESRFSTAFTVSIEARHGVTTGVSASDRVTTIQAAISNVAKPEDLVRPGHVFPLRAHADGVLGRRGHTEGAVDLARLAGLTPAAVLCELMNPDGTMARGSDITAFATEHDLPVISIADLINYRRINRPSLCLYS